MKTPKTTGSSDSDGRPEADRTRVGRNDPCPCGSGKKYKKCCGDKDRQNAPDRVAPGWTPEDLPLPDTEEDVAAAPDNLPARKGPRLNRDQYEKRISRFQRALDSKDFCGDGAMELLADMHRDFVQHGELDRYAALVAELRDLAPQAYEETSPYFLNHQISDALAAGDIERVRALAEEMAVEGQKDVDLFFRALHELCLHGQLSILLEMMPIAWEWIAAGKGDIIGYAVDEFRELANSLEIASWADQHSEGNDTEVLAERLKLYGEVVWPRVLESASILSGRARLEWSPTDFADMGKQRRKRQWKDREEDPDADEVDWDQDQAAAQAKLPEGWDRRTPGVNLFLLTLDFMCYARTEEAFAYPTLILACDNLRVYLFDRQDGRHDRQLDAPGRSGRRKPAYVAHNFLVPDEPTMDHWGGELLGFPFPQPSRAAAVLLVLPAWLRFLVARGLATEAEATAALAFLHPLAQTASRVLADNEVSSNILADLRRRWEEPAGL